MNNKDRITVTAADSTAQVEIECNGTPAANGGDVIWVTGVNVVTIKVINGNVECTYTVTVTKYGPTKLTPDPGENGVHTGGADAVFQIDGLTATVSGTIDFYPEDLSLERPPGHRVGFELTAPPEMSAADCKNATYSQDGGPAKPLDNYANLSGRDNVFWWYPLITSASETHTLVIDWDGSGPRPSETIFCVVDGVTLCPETRLASLTIGSLSLTPSFDPDVEQYTATTTNNTNTITAKALDGNASVAVEVDGLPIPNGSPAAWEDGDNEVTIKVESRGETRTYRVVVTKT